MKLSNPQLRVLTAYIYKYFHDQDNPPADEIYVPLENVKESRNEDKTYFATVRFIVDYCGRKVHSIRIKFKVDDKGRFLANTWSFV